ncbi:MAG: DNA-formamidopyrimidine glycosylase family protein [Candidatus Nitrosocosmicus sp.]
MSEGPEVKIIADKIRNVLGSNMVIQNIIGKKIDEDIKNKIIGSSVEYVKTFGKNIVIKFSSGIYLRNHMMMWGKWRTYERNEYDGGLAKSPLTRRYMNWKKKDVGADMDKEIETKNVTQNKDVRQDPRVRLIIITATNVLVQFNGPILQFSYDDPASKEPIVSLGPDALSDNFEAHRVKFNLKNRSIQNTNLLIAEALLDQQIVSGIGNKYKSEILFLCNLYPFKKIYSLSEYELDKIIYNIPKVLSYGYVNKGKTRPLLDGEKSSWNTIHWVFRRSGRPCWICSTKISSEKKLTIRSTFWCSTCQPKANHE